MEQGFGVAVQGAGLCGVITLWLIIESQEEGGRLDGIQGHFVHTLAEELQASPSPWNSAGREGLRMKLLTSICQCVPSLHMLPLPFVFVNTNVHVYKQFINLLILLCAYITTQDGAEHNKLCFFLLDFALYTFCLFVLLYILAVLFVFVSDKSQIQSNPIKSNQAPVSSSESGEFEFPWLGLRCVTQDSLKLCFELAGQEVAPPGV